MHWVVVPFRGSDSAKSRLAGSLSEEARRQISRAMFQHVLNVSCQAAGARRVLVVTPSSSAKKIARRVGAAVLHEDEAGHNEAVTQACALLRARGALTATIIAADLPFLAPEHVASMTALARQGLVAVASDRPGRGTNAIALRLGLPFKFQFGEGSCLRHCAQQEQGKMMIKVVRQRALACDIDVPKDLALLNAPGALSTLPKAGHWQQRSAR